ncbi:hypothetical protein ABR33_00140 [Enterobacter bugandensis]|uniref:hypothetical protein n=1 Tax=Enterobacter bugandensis TaxID=881260 RepID=UPI000642EDCF|nr:hypothetical protein [Enterobacter bugandensis]KLQ40428.1 hypothetical protein ABR33_00140 [Enterobacter bugandensis]
MAKVTAYYSASQKDIVAIVGDGFEEGNMALCISGCHAVPELNTVEDAKAALPYLESDISRMGDLAFLLNGGTLNEGAAENMPAQGYEAIGSFEV